ncbi:hypothetical protein X727_05365 [Mesorhizobium sp. L103C119B0]|nr:hypothetical protein X765_11560 [Mesorhizobium sp. LSHC440B00]ESX31026.1 hypothetical protein X764_30620 [Mesorhizobium sp. LSHC440A00]ESZ72347.1 hypothetical protein X727_05365 [Mesorhizobium sp. L103C119B0]
MSSLLQDVDLSGLVDRQHITRLHAEGLGDYRRDHTAGRGILYEDASLAG